MIIWIASYPKSGNTWIRMFLRSYFSKHKKKFSLNLQGNSDFETRNFPNIKALKEINVDYTKFENIVKNWIPLQDYINLNNKINFMKTHNANLTINGYPFTNKSNTLGGIYVVRDPRDVALSYAHHLKISNDKSVNNLINEKRFELNEDSSSGKNFYRTILGSWSMNYLSWKLYKGREILIIKYEDIIKNPNKSFLIILKYLKKFINFAISDSEISKSIKQTSFNELKKIEENEGFIEQGMSSNFFRKGIVGDYKENLDLKLIKIIEEKFRNEMKELNYL